MVERNDVDEVGSVADGYGSRYDCVLLARPGRTRAVAGTRIHVNRIRGYVADSDGSKTECTVVAAETRDSTRTSMVVVRFLLDLQLPLI